MPARPTGPVSQASGRIVARLTLLLGGEPAYGLRRGGGRDCVPALKLSISNVVAGAPKLRDNLAAAALDREHFVASAVGDKDARGAYLSGRRHKSRRECKHVREQVSI